jgi:hypothetical protein
MVQACHAAGALCLENPRIGVEIDRQTGAILSIRDKEQDVVYPQVGIGFEVVTREGSLRPEKASSVSAKAGQAELRFTGGGLDITLHYRLGAGNHFIEKWLTIKASDGKPCFLKSVFLEDMTTDAFSEIHFHDDNTIWHCPINLFLRGEKGGCFAGVEYPYWDLKQNGKDGFRLGYEPNYQVAKGEVNVSEKYFLGIYRKEGIHRVSQGPYPGRGRYPLMGSFGGLKQHFKGPIPNPVRDVPLEVLDWGEVWAMQEFMRHVLPDEFPLPEKGYWVWQNGWWAGITGGNTAALDLLKKAGIHDVMTAQIWYGRGQHPIIPPYLSQMNIDPMGFPKDAGAAQMPKGPVGAQLGNHVNRDLKELNKIAPGKFTPDFRAPAAMEAFHAYGKKIGVHVSSFSCPNITFAKHPEWNAISENGQTSQYLFGHGVSCPACDPFMDHTLNVLDHVFTKYKPRWWGFDGRWLSYWEVGHYRPGPKGAGPDQCYAKNHGHLPGKNLYKEWKNIEKLLRELRRRHPGVCLETYYGMHRGGPWSLRYFNAAYPFFETHGIMSNRFQAWHLQNGRFNPVYKNTCDLFDTAPAGFENNVITAISMTSYGMMGPAYKGLGLKANRDTLKKWRAWATKNYKYMKVKRDLFDCPGQNPVDGSSHIIKDRGFLFLFSVGGKETRASIPISRWLQLAENPKALYQLREVHPRAGADLGVYRYGEDFLYDMPKGAAVVISLEPAPRGSTPRRPKLAEKPGVTVTPAFSSVDPATLATAKSSKAASGPAKPRKPTYWHWPFDELIENRAATPDASPNKVHIRLSGQELCEGVVGKALRFDAGNKGIGIGDLGLRAPATLSFWLKAESSKADRRILSQLEGPTTQSGCLRLIEGSLQVWNAQGWPVVVDGLNDKDGWQHVAVVYEADGTVTGYRNGKKAKATRSAFDFAGVKAAIGAPFLGQYGLPFIGVLDDFRIHNRALGEKDIKAIKEAAGKGGPGAVQRRGED